MTRSTPPTCHRQRASDRPARHGGDAAGREPPMYLRRTLAITVATCSVGLAAVIGGPSPASAAVTGGRVLALQPGNVLVAFDAADPGTLTQTTIITGMLGGESIVGFDVRPATGDLVAVGVGGTSGHVYVINSSNGVATPVSATAFSSTLPTGGTWSVDFNPTVDRIRFVHSGGTNYRLDPEHRCAGGDRHGGDPGDPDRAVLRPLDRCHADGDDAVRDRCDGLDAEPDRRTERHPVAERRSDHAGRPARRQRQRGEHRLRHRPATARRWRPSRSAAPTGCTP